MERVVETLRFCVDPDNPDRLTLRPVRAVLRLLLIVATLVFASWLFFGIGVPALGHAATLITGRPLSHQGVKAPCIGNLTHILSVCVRGRTPCPCAEEGTLVVLGIGLAVLLAWFCFTTLSYFLRACKSHAEIARLRAQAAQKTCDVV